MVKIPPLIFYQTILMTQKHVENHHNFTDFITFSLPPSKRTRQRPPTKARPRKKNKAKANLVDHNSFFFLFFVKKWTNNCLFVTFCSLFLPQSNHPTGTETHQNQDHGHKPEAIKPRGTQPRSEREVTEHILLDVKSLGCWKNQSFKIFKSLTSNLEHLSTIELA